MFVFFRPIGKIRWPSWPLIGWDISDFSYETAERNSTKLDRKQDLNALYQVCVFWADRKKQDGHPGLWLAKTFLTSPLKPLNGIQRNLTGSKISTSSTKFVFFGPIEKKNGHPGQSAKKVAHCTQVHDMWPFGPLVSIWNRLFYVNGDFFSEIQDSWHMYVLFLAFRSVSV